MGKRLKPPQIRQLTELKSGFREGLHLIKWVDEGKAIINVTHLGEASVGGGSNYKSPSGDLGVDKEESEKHCARCRKFVTCVLF